MQPVEVMRATECQASHWRLWRWNSDVAPDRECILVINIMPSSSLREQCDVLKETLENDVSSEVCRDGFLEYDPIEAPLWAVFKDMKTQLIWRTSCFCHMPAFKKTKNCVLASSDEETGLEIQQVSHPPGCNMERRRSRAVLYQLSGHLQKQDKSKLKINNVRHFVWGDSKRGISDLYPRFRFTWTQRYQNHWQTIMTFAEHIPAPERMNFFFGFTTT